MRKTRRLLASSAVLVLVGAACSSTVSPTPARTPLSSGSQSVLSASSSPEGSAAPSGAASAAPAGGWIAARVAQPAEIEGQPTNAPAFCSPCHPITGTYIQALVPIASGYLALGEQQPPSVAAAWSSTDAAAWQRVGNLPAPQGSNIAAALAGPGGVVAVGSNGTAAAVWRMAAGGGWSMSTLAPPPAGATEQLDAVAATGNGYVAAGFTQSSTAVKTASIWRSGDGVSWSRAQVPGATGAAEVAGLAANANVVIAVGISGDERRGTAAVWRSTDGGSSWSSVSSSAFGAGRMLAVTFGSGVFAAVGENVDQTAAAAWTSTDGSAWSLAPEQPALANAGMQMVMMAIAVDGSAGFVADGWSSDAGNGSAVVWRSQDGMTWTRYPQDASFSGAGMAAILVRPTSPRLVAAGTMGWPDTHAAQVWIGPQP
jgi:hypothetical protein